MKHILRRPLSYSRMRLYLSLLFIYLHMVNSLGIWYICVHIPNDLSHPKLFVTVCRSLSVSQSNNSLLCFRPALALCCSVGQVGFCVEVCE